MSTIPKSVLLEIQYGLGRKSTAKDVKEILLANNVVLPNDLLIPSILELLNMGSAVTICHGGHVKETDKLQDYMPPLHWAVQQNNKELVATVIAFLIETYSDLDNSTIGKDSNEQITALFWGIIIGAEAEIIGMLHSAGASLLPINRYRSSAIGLAAIFGRCKIAHLLLEEGADTNSKNANGTTPLQIAISMDDFPFVSLLLTPKYEVDLSLKDANGLGALHYACSHQSPGTSSTIKILKAVLEAINESEINAQTSDGTTALHLAVQVACTRGDSSSLGDDMQWTIDQDRIKLLLSKGASPNIQRHDGIRPVDIVLRYVRLHAYLPSIWN